MVDLEKQLGAIAFVHQYLADPPALGDAGGDTPARAADASVLPQPGI